MSQDELSSSKSTRAKMFKAIENAKQTDVLVIRMSTSGSNLKLELTHDSPDGEVVVTKELVAHPAEKLVLYVRDNLVGNNEVFNGPFGRKKIVRCDYMQNGGSLKFIEDHLAKEVAPYLTNDPSTTTVTGLQSTMYFDEVKNIIRKATNASNGDELFFIPSGSSPKDQNTKVIRHFIEMTKLFSPIVLTSVQIDSKVMVPLVEAGGNVITVSEEDNGSINLDTLKEILDAHKSTDRPIVGIFKAMSDITGVISEDLEITALCHSFGAMVLWDYTEAGPNVHIDMNPKVPRDEEDLYKKDVLFFDGNMFIGGLQGFQVLIMKRALCHDLPREFQGSQLSCWDLLAIVRTGMALQLKQAVTAQFIVERQVRFNTIITEKLSKVSNLFILGSQNGSRGNVVSFVVQHNLTGLFLHQNYVCALLNDLFGIQSRTFSALDHSYAKRIFNIDKNSECHFLVEANLEGRKPFQIILPGYTQISLPWYFTDEEVEFVTNAIELVCRKGWILLPQYIFMRQTGEWHHQINLAFCDRKCLTNITYENGVMQIKGESVSNGTRSVFVLNDAILKAKETFGNAKRQNQGFKVPDCTALFSEAAQHMRWFLLPSEAKDLMSPFRKYIPIASHRLSLLQFSNRSSHCNSNSIGTLGGNAEFSNDLSNETRESRKPLERGYWLKHCKVEKLGEKEFKATAEEPINHDEKPPGRKQEQEQMPEDIKEPPKASLSSWFRRKKSIPSVNENLLNDGTEIIETGQQWSRTPPSPVSQIIVRSSEIPVQLVNTQEINPNLDLSLDEELEPTMENNLHTNLESIPEEGPQDVLDGEQRNAQPNLDPPEVFFDKFMDKWDKDREQRGCQPETYIYGLEQHQSGKEANPERAEIHVN